MENDLRAEFIAKIVSSSRSPAVGALYLMSGEKCNIFVAWSLSWQLGGSRASERGNCNPIVIGIEVVQSERIGTFGGGRHRTRERKRKREADTDLRLSSQPTAMSRCLYC